MRFQVLACDYDGTLATRGVVGPETVAGLERFRNSGRQLVMVTGRELPELRSVFPRFDLFDWVVAENGALLYQPSSGLEVPLAEPPPATFVDTLKARGVAPISCGRVIIATWHPHETVVMTTIRDFGLELQVIFNKGAVMILPSGVNKGTGLTACLKQMGLTPTAAVGIGDAENDHSLLGLCEVAVAVSNALPMLKERADLVTVGDHGAGVVELIDKILADDLAQLTPYYRLRQPTPIV